MLTGYIKSCGNCSRDVLDYLCDRFAFELDKSSRMVCSISYYAGVTEDKACAPQRCPGFIIFLGAYLDRFGFNNKEAFEYLQSLLNGYRLRSSGKQPEVSQIISFPGLDKTASCVHSDMIGFLLHTTEYLAKTEAKMIQKKDKVTDEPKQYYSKIYEDRESMFRHTTYDLEERLIQAVISGNEDTAVLALKDINRSGNKAILASDSIRSAKNSIICTCVFLARASIRAGVAPDSAFAISDAVIRRIEEFTGKEEVLAYEENILIQFIKLVRRRKTSGLPRHVRRAIHYIDSNLNERIRLKEIALYTGVTPQYLSRLFSTKMQMSITGYIMMRKVQESSYFISHKEYSIADVAMLYGFSNQSYFITVFKKYMGVTPGEYRNKT